MACFICNKITLDRILWFHNVIAQILGDYCGFGTVRNQLSNLREFETSVTTPTVAAYS